MVKKYIVDLTEEERQFLLKTVNTGRNPAYRVNHARILLKADRNHPDGGLSDQAIALALDLSIPTIERVRKRFVCESLEKALNRRQNYRKPCSFRGEHEAQLIALACGDPPEGKSRWTVRLLADKMIELGYIEFVSHETVRQVLKKTNFNLIVSNLG